MPKHSDQFNKKEAKQRFEAALRGARLAEPKPMSAITPKRNLSKVETKSTKAKPTRK